MRRFLATLAFLAFTALGAAACSTGYGPAREGYGSSIPPSGGADTIYRPGMGGANG
jgi:hypothetical protein